MKAPDKIYVEVCEDGVFAFPEPPFVESVEYIRADINKQPVEGLADEIDNEWEKCNPIDEGMGVEIALIHIEQFDHIARHFAEWGAEHLKRREMDRYEEALKRAKAAIEVAAYPEEVRKVAETIFPELRESEDERIINAIIGILKNSNAIDINVSQERMFAWLEKQKEQKPAEWSEDFDKEVENIHKRYPEVSFAKLTRIAYHFSKWANRQKPAEWSEEDEK